MIKIRLPITAFAMFVSIAILYSPGPALAIEADAEASSGSPDNRILTLEVLSRMSSRTILNILVFWSIEDSRYQVEDMNRYLSNAALRAFRARRGNTENLMERMKRTASLDERKRILEEELKSAKRRGSVLYNRWQSTLPRRDELRGGSFALRDLLVPLIAGIDEDDPRLNILSDPHRGADTPEARANRALSRQMDQNRTYIRLLTAWIKEPGQGPKPD